MCWVSGSSLWSLQPHCAHLLLLQSSYSALCCRHALCVLVFFTRQCLLFYGWPLLYHQHQCAAYFALNSGREHKRGTWVVLAQSVPRLPSSLLCWTSVLCVRLPFYSRVPLCCPATMCGNMDFTGRPPLKGSEPVAPAKN